MKILINYWSPQLEKLPSEISPNFEMPLNFGFDIIFITSFQFHRGVVYFSSEHSQTGAHDTHEHLVLFRMMAR